MIRIASGIAVLCIVSTAQHAQAQTHRPAAAPQWRASWPGYAGDAWHRALSPIASQSLSNVHWWTPVDLQPQYSGGKLFIHYGSPLITPRGTIVVTLKTGAADGFRVDGHASGSGILLWTFVTDYVLMPHHWTPALGPALTARGELAIPGAGGTVHLRSRPDSILGTTRRSAFYGLANYAANSALYDANVMIDTPITSDARGNLYFGFVVLGANPAGLESGIARIDGATGAGTWTSAHAAAGDALMRKVVFQCAPALSLDGSSIYVAVNDVAGWGAGHGYLLRLDSQTLALQSRVRLEDVAHPGLDANLADDGSCSPTVGPDGDVYFGVLENPFLSHNLRGWLLHFDATLAVRKTPGAFGWDDTPSIVPASAVPSYSGASTYLLFTKYNNYSFVGTGDGQNEIAVLDPNGAGIDPLSGATVMSEVLTVLSPTPDPAFPGGVTEWCVNTAVIDAQRRCALVSNADGTLYRWNFATNSLAESITLGSGIGEAYTPTLIGPDGVVYAVNNGILYAIGD